jgi:glycosyltransferase involved in cell wall biosynthesis
MIDRTQYIFLSNGQKGGVATFVNDHINYLSKTKKDLLLIDNNPKKTYENLNKKINLYKFDKNKKKLDKILNTGSKKKILFITNYAFLIWYYFILKNFRKRKNKIVLTIHSGLLTLKLKNYLAGLLFSMIYKNTDYLFFGSKSAKDWWKKKYPWMKIENCKVFHNGIKTRKKQSIRKLGKKINISFAANLEIENNPIFFLDICTMILKMKKNIVFNIFGMGSLFHKLKRCEEKNIIFHGWTKKNIIFKKSDLLVITSKVNNFPYAALEAKSYGIPVISCSKGDIDKIIKNGKDGFVKHTNKPEIMITLIDKILKNYEFFSKNSYLRSFKFEVNKSCEKFWRKIKIENNNFR